MELYCNRSLSEVWGQMHFNFKLIDKFQCPWTLAVRQFCLQFSLRCFVCFHRVDVGSVSLLSLSFSNIVQHADFRRNSLELVLTAHYSVFVA